MPCRQRWRLGLAEEEVAANLLRQGRLLKCAGALIGHHPDLDIDVVLTAT
jgi:hypothetical protein